MDWAATRKTTMIKDEAYCLLGIFGINMPLLYGEGRNAFFRLQKELIQHSDDQSIFAWACNDDPELEPYRQGVLAKSPAAFLGCSWVEYRGRNSHREPFSLVNTGISIKAPCSVDFYQPDGADDSRWHMMLRCGPKNEPTRVMTLPIYRIQDRGDFFHRRSRPEAMPYSTCMRWRGWKPKLITLSVQQDGNSSEGGRELWSTPVWIKTLPPGFYFTEFSPPSQWSRARVVRVPAPGRSSFKSFCSIRHSDSGVELTLLLINRPRFEALARRVKTQPVTRIKVILLPSADAPEMSELGSSRHTWPGGKTLMCVKTRYEPTMDGPLLALSIEERDARQRYWILVQDNLHQIVIDLADIFNTFSGRLVEKGVDLREIGLLVTIVLLTAVTEMSGHLLSRVLGWEDREVQYHQMALELAPYFVFCWLIVPPLGRQRMLVLRLWLLAPLVPALVSPYRLSEIPVLALLPVILWNVTGML